MIDSIIPFLMNGVDCLMKHMFITTIAHLTLFSLTWVIETIINK